MVGLPLVVVSFRLYSRVFQKLILTVLAAYYLLLGRDRVLGFPTPFSVAILVTRGDGTLNRALLYAILLTFGYHATELGREGR